MRSIIAIVSAALMSFAAVAATPKTVVLDVQNMTCGLCPVTVKKSLQRVPGVSDARVDLDKKTATVTFDAQRATTADLVNATSDAGFPSTAR